MTEAATSPTVSSQVSRPRYKCWLWVSGAMLAVFVLLLLVLPEFIDLANFKSSFLPSVEKALGRQVDVGEVRLSLLPTPAIRVSKIAVSDTASFPNKKFFTTEEMRLRLKFFPLLIGRFEVKEFILEQPVFNLLKHADGTLNYSDLAKNRTPVANRREAKKRTAKAKATDLAVVPLVIPARMRINKGQLNLVTQGQKPVHIDGIELSMDEFTGDHPFAYQASFNYPGLKTISLRGDLSYREEDAKLELVRNRLRVNDIEFPIEGSVTHLSSVPKVDLRTRSEQLETKAVFEILSVFSLAPRDTEISGPMTLSVQVTGPSNGLITEVRGSFKDVMVHGKRAVKGSLAGNVMLKLPLGRGSPLQRLQGDGQVQARDGELTNMNLIKRVQRVTGMIGFNQDQRREVTTFKSFETEFVIGGGVANFSRIFLTNAQMEVTGNGTMTLERPELDLDLQTLLSPQASSRAAHNQSLTTMKDHNGRIVVPLKVTGPVENPSVKVNTKKLLDTGIVRSLEKNFGSLFKQFFRRR